MKRIIFFTLIAIAILSMVHSVQSVYSLWQKRDIILQTQKEVQKEQTENSKLKQQLQVISQSAFVEEQARDKLFMVKSGEKMVFIPTDEMSTRSGRQFAVEQTLSSWQQWWNLFFK
ncbi:MAG: septum formation initiator family protein [Patescibacteria group bacterium]|nr:septum formation initiator family protein [Patescibacteria group bacterium]